MRFRFLPAAFAGLLLTGAFVAAEGCSSFEETGGPPDATDDSALNDAYVADVLGSDTSAEAGSFCATHPAAAFCADFETVPLERGWTGEFISSDAATLSLLDGGSEASPLHAAGAFVGADPSALPLDAAMDDDGSNRTSALLAKELATLTATRVSLDLDLRVDALPSTSPGALAAICALTDTTDEARQPSVYFTVVPDTSRINGLVLALSVDATGSAPLPQYKPIQPALHTWFHVRLTIDRSAGSVKLQIDGVDVLGLQPSALFADSKILSLAAGIFGIPNREDMSVAIDNVVVDLVEPP